MVTESQIKTQFIHQTISDGINLIYDMQRRTVQQHLNSRSGNLLKSLTKYKIDFKDLGNKNIYYISVLPYLRFIDIAYRQGNDRISRHIRKNLSLYNRVVWGVLYHETFPELRYGFTKEIRDKIDWDLNMAFK